MSAATWPTASLSMPFTTMRSGVGHFERDALGRVDEDRVAEPERQLELLWALQRRAVADADDLELLGETGRDAGHHVLNETPSQAVQSPVAPLVIGPLDEQLERPGSTDGDAPGQVPMQSPLWAGHRHVAVLQRHLDARGHLDRAPSDSGHQLVTFGSPDITKHLTADTLLACLAIGHETLARREHCHAEPA